MKKTPKIYLLVILLAIIAGVVLLVRSKPVREAELKATPATHVAVAAVKTQDLAGLEQLTGRLQPARRTALQFELTGQVLARKVEPGQRVQTGDVLLSLPDGDYQDALADAKAQLEQDRAGGVRDKQLLALGGREQELQSQAVARMEKLGRDALASKSQADEARARLLQLQSDEARLRYSVDTGETTIRQRETAVSRAQRNLERTQLRAPFAGVVNAVNVQAGDAVSPGIAAVELLDVSELDVYLEVTGSTAAALQLGQKIKVHAGGNDATPVDVTAEVVALQADPNLTTQTHSVRLRLPGDGLQPGSLAVADLPLTPLHGALVVPVVAVEQEEGRAYVFIVNDGAVQRAEVRLGNRVRDLQVISSGLKAGQQIVARDVAALADGEKVIAEPVEPDAVAQQAGL